MALTGIQYQSMRLKFRGLISNPYWFVSEAELDSFLGQLQLDASGSVTAAQKTQGDALLATLLAAPAFSPTSANVADLFATATAALPPVLRALVGARYQQLKSTLTAALSIAGIRTEAQMLGYVAGFFGILGQVATRASTPNNTFGTATTFMNRTGHIARDAITSLQAAWANWACINPSGYSAPAGTLTVTASVEYPAGTFTQIKWSGSASVVIASGTNPLSDAVTIPGGIPNGATFWIRSFLAPSANICYGDGTNKSATIGDLCMNSGSSDMTLGGTITDNSASVIFPVALVAQTSRRTCLLLGHSMVGGLQDQAADATGDNGDLQRPLNPQFGTIRTACVGETVQNFITKATQRLALATYCTDVVMDFSANDLNGGRTAAQITADYVSLAALVPSGKKIWLGTASPVAVTTSDAYATLANQTVGASEAQRQLLNTAIRANISGFTGFIELADFVEQARGGKWKVDGTANKYTSDGTHQSTFANQQITIALP